MEKRIATDGPALSRRAFFGQATAATVLVAAGCLPEKVGGGPRLKVGVLSDVHLLVQKDSMHSDVYFEKEPSMCVFGKFELPSDKPVTFTVRPADSFGVHGQPLPPVTWQA